MEWVNQPLTPLAGYLLTVIFGIWLNRTGRPYPAALFNLHKLIALGGVILGAVMGWRSGMMAVMSVGEYAAVFLCATSILALFASGGLMSAGKLDQRQMRFTHAIAAILLTAAGMGAYMLVSQ